jgi:glycolate oxidase FAD binding subunit
MTASRDGARGPSDGARGPSDGARGPSDGARGDEVRRARRASEAPRIARDARAQTREPGAGDVIAGVAPRVVIEPASLAEAADVMADAARGGLRVGFVGGGTALGLGAPPRGLDAVIRTGRLARILEYAPADMVIVVEAGVTLAAVQAEVARHGQRLALDPPAPERATIGGLIATGASGPLRLRHGAIRDLIIGVTLVRADGEVARGGGKVVKNVAGFDLPKVACGSLGTLGLIAGAAFRLHPLPEATATLRVAPLAPEAVVAVMAAARDAQLEPAAAIAIAEPPADERPPVEAPPRFALAVRFEGFDRGVRDQVDRFVAIARAFGAVDEDTDVWARHDAIRAGDRVRVAALPTQLPEVARLLPGLAWYPTLGLGFAPHALDDAGLARARAALPGGSIVVEAGASADPWGPVPSGLAIMRQLKQRFDPDHRLNPGRFAGGL